MCWNLYFKFILTINIVLFQDLTSTCLECNREIDWVEQIVTNFFTTEAKQYLAREKNREEKLIKLRQKFSNFVFSSIKTFFKLYFHYIICLVCFCICMFGLFTFRISLDILMFKRVLKKGDIYYFQKCTNLNKKHKF